MRTGMPNYIDFVSLQRDGLVYRSYLVTRLRMPWNLIAVRSLHIGHGLCTEVVFVQR